MSKNAFNEIGKIVGLLALGLVLAIGAWYVKRQWNYYFSYEGQVTATIEKKIEPLNKKISELEKRISILEKKSK